MWILDTNGAARCLLESRRGVCFQILLQEPRRPGLCSFIAVVGVPASDEGEVFWARDVRTCYNRLNQSNTTWTQDPKSAYAP
jgi:hypothetical protein